MVSESKVYRGPIPKNSSLDRSSPLPLSEFLELSKPAREVSCHYQALLHEKVGGPTGRLASCGGRNPRTLALKPTRGTRSFGMDNLEGPWASGDHRGELHGEPTEADQMGASHRAVGEDRVHDDPFRGIIRRRS